MTYEQYDTPEYRKHCREILAPVINQAKEYQHIGYELTGLLGIKGSPSCDPGRGVFMEELFKMFGENEIQLKTLWYLPNTADPAFNSDEHFVKVEEGK
jgi:predicted secreted protein